MSAWEKMMWLALIWLGCGTAVAFIIGAFIGAGRGVRVDPRDAMRKLTYQPKMPVLDAGTGSP